MNITNEIINEIRNKIDIVEIISNYVPLTQRGKNYFGVCPFHDDHNPSMSVSKEKQMYKCFVCGAAGNVFNFVMDYEKISYYEAVRIVANKIGIDIDIGNIRQEKNKDSKLYEIYEFASKYYQNYLKTSSGKIARNYLTDRNIDDELVKQFQIGLSETDGKLTSLLQNKKISDEDILKSGISIEKNGKLVDIYNNRIMFPLWNIEGQVVGFSGRIFEGESTSKYVNTMETEIFKKGDLLYNYHNAKEHARKEKQVIVVEGFMDVIRLYSIGIKNVVATMGTAITPNQASLIRKLSQNIILMFDGDDAGEKATIAAIKELDKTDSEIKVVRLENKLDPDEYVLTKGKDKMLKHLSSAMSLLNYKSEKYKEKLNFKDSNDVSKYINLMKKDLEKIDDDIVRDIEVKKISDLTGVSIETINSKLDISDKNVKIINHVVKKDNLKQNKYDKASKFILFYMTKNSELIDYYYNNLSYLPNELDRTLANEMVLFYKKFEGFNINDFIIYLEDKKELINRLVEIDGLEYKDDYNKEMIDSYFNVIKDYLKQKEIEKLTEELKNTTNEVLRREIASKIVSIKLKESK